MGNQAEIGAGYMLAVARAREAAQNGVARELRIRAHLTLADVGAVIGRPAATIQRWETGLRRPSRDAAVRYGALLEALARQLEENPVNDHDPAGNRVVGKVGDGDAQQPV
jgi:transcriptional regulator with XRE-family HTH domain